MKPKDTKSVGAAAAIVEEIAELPRGTKRKINEIETGDEVSYVLDRPYVAGELPEIVAATVMRVHDKEPGVVDLEVTPAGTKKTGRPYSERREVGTWHFPPRE